MGNRLIIHSIKLLESSIYYLLKMACVALFQWYLGIEGLGLGRECFFRCTAALRVAVPSVWQRGYGVSRDSADK
jgi:hypothetical protein